CNLSDNYWQAVYLLDYLRCNHFSSSVCMNLSTLQENKPVCVPESLVKVVHGHNGCNPVFKDNLPDNGKDLNLISQIKAACGFVKEEDFWLLYEGTSD